ncbi:MAG: LPS assembly lipoprotein LptE, partial [Bacteroidota bacterium]
MADFASNVAQGPADLAEKFTETLNQALLQRTALNSVEEDGDIQFEGTITQFKYYPAASTSSSVSDMQDEASKLRLSITVEVNYRNPHNKKFSFDKKEFTQHEDAPADSAMEEESELVKKIFDKLLRDIFNASV